MNTLEDFIFNSGFLAVCAVIIAIVYGVLKFIFEYSNIKSKNKLREEYRKSFTKIVANLSSKDHTTQLSSAILLRSFFNKEVYKNAPNLAKEAIDVISSLIRTLPTTIFQKTLADGLSYAKDLSSCDFQKTNLQDVFLGKKEGELLMNKTDLFLADLSYANLKNIVGHEIVFYRSILFCTRIKDCDFTKANFTGADLTGVYFENCTLTDANFSHAINIPESIQEKLENNIFKDSNKITTKNNADNKIIFFSMPGVMSNSDEYLTKEYKRILEKRDFNVIYYTPDKYPQFGQFNKVRNDIYRSAGMIAFGFKQLNIQKGFYRPNTKDQIEWQNKWLSTPWSEIEVGMGLMKGMPILLVSDPDLNNGVFDNKLNECFVAKISTTENSKNLEHSTIFDEWISRIV
jgi:uncharacterized protein YjbI with pentapeptide repeats